MMNMIVKQLSDEDLGKLLELRRKTKNVQSFEDVEEIISERDKVITKYGSPDGRVDLDKRTITWD